MTSTSSCVTKRAVEPRDFPTDPINRFWRGIMFGTDAPATPFIGLSQRFYDHQN